VTSGEVMTCGTRSDDSRWCWGGWDSLNELSQLDPAVVRPHRMGDGTGTPATPARRHPEPVSPGAPDDWGSLNAGNQFFCGLRVDHTLWCWGWNGGGRLGEGTTETHDDPVQVGSAATWTAVALGDDHTCAAQTDGSLWCWGSNDSGQLGTGTAQDYASPRPVPDTTWTAVEAGDDHVCGIRSDGSLWCWGTNLYGLLGNGTPTQSRVPPVQITLTVVSPAE
jgi:alpha-tubulin suppressor-like RCC1 family protein